MLRVFVLCQRPSKMTPASSWPAHPGHPFLCFHRHFFRRGCPLKASLRSLRCERGHDQSRPATADIIAFLSQHRFPLLRKMLWRSRRGSSDEIRGPRQLPCLPGWRRAAAPPRPGSCPSSESRCRRRSGRGLCPNRPAPESRDATPEPAPDPRHRASRAGGLPRRLHRAMADRRSGGTVSTAGLARFRVRGAASSN